MASMGGASRAARSIVAVVEGSAAEADVFQAIISSLIKITHQIEVWGGLLNQISTPPDVSTVYDAANALSDFNGELISLDRWLNKTKSEYWIVLQSQLHIAREMYINSNIRPYISSYLSYLDSVNSIQSRVQIEKYRMSAGDGLIEFAGRLKDAIEHAIEASQPYIGEKITESIKVELKELMLSSIEEDDKRPDGYISIKVFYATDRKSTGKSNPSDFYNNRRGVKLQFGICEVTIPASHRYGKVEVPSITRLEFRKNSSKHFVLTSVNPLNADDFFRQAANHILQTEGKEAIVFVHGYNTSFEDAAYRTAQIAHDLKFDGAPILYSWPSKGTITGYMQDAQTIQWTAGHLQEFLEDISEKTGAERVHLIAHSMGNQALSRALDKIADKMQDTSPTLFEQVLLTAPDIDIDLFKRYRREFPQIRPACNIVCIIER